jgi:hypothetical protein
MINCTIASGALLSKPANSRELPINRDPLALVQAVNVMSATETWL